MLAVSIAPTAAGAQGGAPDITAMLDHAAIVENMMRACGHKRPDLADRLSDAIDAWWDRNATIRETLATLRREADTSVASKRYLDYYEALKAKLTREIDDLQASGNTAFIGNCDRVLREMTAGELDYPSPSRSH